MATKYFTAEVEAVAQVESGSIDSVDGTPANNTFTITISGVSVTVTGDTDVTTTADALVLAANTATHPYFSTITFANNAGTITATCDKAGMPMAADPVLSKAGAGTGTVTDFTNSTAATGPYHWDAVGNWEPSGVPANTDDVIIEGLATSILYGLDQNAVTLASLTIRQTFTGKIGLDLRQFVTEADGETASAAASETREDYLRIGADRIDIGQHIGPGEPAGSQRIKIDNTKSGASTLVVYNTANSSAETGFPAVRYKAAHADADVIVRGARAGLGIAKDEAGETSTVGDISVQDGALYVGEGVTLTTLTQTGGEVVLQAAATVTTVTVEDGTLTTEGDYTITTLNANGGTVNCNHTKTSGNAVTTLTLAGGTVDGTANAENRTWATVNANEGSLRINPDDVTITTFNQPSSAYSMEITA